MPGVEGGSGCCCLFVLFSPLNNNNKNPAWESGDEIVTWPYAVSNRPRTSLNLGFATEEEHV